VINQSNGKVSFYPAVGFSGTRTTRFHADDGQFNASSNTVYLFVGSDEEAPHWSSPERSITTVYQSDYVNFSTLWTDNSELKSFIFSIDRGSGWLNYSETSMTGPSNTSIKRLQMVSPGGTQISWRFYGFDIAGNMNYTDIQTFTLATRPLPPSPALPPSQRGLKFSKEPELLKPKKGIKNFTVSPSFIRVLLKQGETKTRILQILNPR